MEDYSKSDDALDKNEATVQERVNIVQNICYLFWQRNQIWIHSWDSSHGSVDTNLGTTTFTFKNTDIAAVYMHLYVYIGGAQFKQSLKYLRMVLSVVGCTQCKTPPLNKKSWCLNGETILLYKLKQNKIKYML